MADITFEWILPEGKVGAARMALQEADVEAGKPTPWEPDEEELADAVDPGH